MWITGDVDLPVELVEALASDELVLFVGAGASINPPSNLPLFPGLAEEIAERAVEPFDPLMPTDTFLGRLEDRFNFDVHRHAKEITSAPSSRFNSVHSALVTLASVGTPRIITTNYDDHLHEAALAAGIDLGDRYDAPALPRGASFSGLVHVHGTVQRSSADFVLTDRDFGRAYLTEAWASRFLQGVFSRYTVLFVGYSHADVVMNYLAMGLPPGAKRFALTDTPLHERWERLQITAVGYPPDNDHLAAQQAIEALASRARMGLLDHESRIHDIVAGGPPKTPVDIDYLDSMLRTSDGARAFAAVATDPSWLEWMESRTPFSALFSAHEELALSSATLAEWFAVVHASSPERTDHALRAIQRLGQDVHDVLLGRLSWSTKELWATDPEAARRWQALIASSLGRSAPRGDPHGALLHKRSPDEALNTIVLRRVLEPYLKLRKPFSWGEVDPVRPAHDLAWAVDVDALETAIETLDTNTRPEDLAHLYEQALVDAYELLAAYRDGSWDELSFRRSAVEPHEQDDRVDVVDVIIDGLRDFGERARASQLRGLVERWSGSPHNLFRRLAVHLLGSSRRSADKKIDWVLERELLFDSDTKHEVFQLLAKSLPEASNAARARLLERTLRGPDE